LIFYGIENYELAEQSLDPELEFQKAPSRPELFPLVKIPLKETIVSGPIGIGITGVARE
jgi:hypothetical protein